MKIVTNNKQIDKIENKIIFNLFVLEPNIGDKDDRQLKSTWKKN